MPIGRPEWPASRLSNDAVPVDVVGLPSRGEGRNPGTDTFPDFACACAVAAEVDVLMTVFLFLSDMAIWVVLEHKKARNEEICVDILTPAFALQRVSALGDHNRISSLVQSRGTEICEQRVPQWAEGMLELP